MQNKVSAVKCRTRLTSLQTLQHCISCVHKSRTYSVWSAFLPPDPTAGEIWVPIPIMITVFHFPFYDNNHGVVIDF